MKVSMTTNPVTDTFGRPVRLPVRGQRHHRHPTQPGDPRQGAPPRARGRRPAQGPRPGQGRLRHHRQPRAAHADEQHHRQRGDARRRHARRAGTRAAADDGRDLAQRRPTARAGRRPAAAGHLRPERLAGADRWRSTCATVVDESASAVASLLATRDLDVQLRPARRAGAGERRPQPPRARRDQPAHQRREVHPRRRHDRCRGRRDEPDRPGCAQRHRHRPRHPRVRPRQGLRPVLPLGGGPGAARSRAPGWDCRS